MEQSQLIAKRQAYQRNVQIAATRTVGCSHRFRNLAASTSLLTRIVRDLLNWNRLPVAKVRVASYTAVLLH